MKYILDTNVVSELRRKKAHGGLLAWYQRQELEDMVMAAVVPGEIQEGIEKTRTQDVKKAAEIEDWLERFSGRTLTICADEKIFRAQARLMARYKTLQPEDALIAATAKVHGMAIATRNVKDFAGLGIAVVNPFDYR